VTKITCWLIKHVAKGILMITNDNEVLQVYEQDKRNQQHDKNTIKDRCYRFHRSSSGFVFLFASLQILT